MAVAVRLNPKVLPAALALGLLALGIPQTGDSILWQLTGDTPDQPGAASPGSVAEATHNAVLLERADDWFDDPRARIRAGILRLRIATTNSDGTVAAAVSAPELGHAQDDLRDGLKSAPANAMGWTALAQASLAAGDRPGAQAALLTSLLLDEHNPEISLWRCALGLTLWSYLDQDGRRMWNEQVNMAWRRQSMDVVALARQNPVFALLIRLALVSDSSRLRDFDSLYNAQH
jgi:hypothetical protein